jgi:hypothetical protein
MPFPSGAGPAERTGPRGALCTAIGRSWSYRHQVTSLPGGSDQGGSTPELRLPLVCARCGASAAGSQPATWTCSVENGIRQYFCDACSRENLRAIEGRLDSAWW